MEFENKQPFSGRVIILTFVLEANCVYSLVAEESVLRRAARCALEELLPVSCLQVFGRSPSDTCAPQPGLPEVPATDVRAPLLTSY